MLFNNNNQHCLVRVTLNSKADKLVALILISGSNWNLECWFLWREENQRTLRKTLRTGPRTNNNLNPHVTPGPGIEPRPQCWEASGPTTAPSLHPQSFSSHPKAKVSCLWHPDASRAQPCLLLYIFLILTAFLLNSRKTSCS